MAVPAQFCSVRHSTRRRPVPPPGPCPTPRDPRPQSDMASEAVRVPDPVPDPGNQSAADEEAIESLRKEIERLKTRLEEERKKLNDVTCENPLFHRLSLPRVPPSTRLPAACPGSATHSAPFFFLRAGSFDSCQSTGAFGQLEHKAEESVKGTPGKGAVSGLVFRRQTSHCQLISGRKDDHMGCFYH